MTAAQMNQYGGNEVVTIVPNAPEPLLAPGHLLVEVHAASVNPTDWKLREGLAQAFVHQPFPLTLGGDFSGVVTQIGEGVTGFKVGDAVFGQSDIREMGSGAFAQVTAPDASYVGLKPTQASHEEAAALPLTGCSTWEVLVEHMQLSAGRRILIHGGAGGIGTIAVQLAKHIGAYIITTAGTNDLAYVKELGADEAIDYQTQSFDALVRDVDAVFDTVGGETYAKSFAVLKPGGIIVSMLEQPNTELMAQYGVTAIAQASKVTTERLSHLSQLVDQGVIKVKIDRIFPLNAAAEALEYLKGGHPKGKVVITMTSE